MEALVPDRDPTRPAPTTWDEYVDWLMPRWHDLLASDPTELAVQQFLEQNPALLPGSDGDIGPGGHHGPHLDAVFREPLLKGLNRDQRPDFMWITRSTSLITPICIEIERPAKRWFTQDGQRTAEWTQAEDQLLRWRAWFEEAENQSIFRKTYHLGDYENRRLLPQYLLIYGRSAEFERASGGHIDAAALRKKRDVGLRPDEQRMTFDSLRPNYHARDFVTLTMSKHGPTLHAVPPCFTTGPSMGSLVTTIRDPAEAVNRTPLWTETRKKYVTERWLHWQKIEEDRNAPRIRSNQSGE